MAKQPPWAPSERTLRNYAKVHLAYEVRILYAQVEHLSTSESGRLEDTWDLSCFEAALVHLRLLDDFFRATPTGDDVVATHFLPTWRSAGFLTAAERRRINAQVAHLAGRRGRPTHNQGSMARRCSARFDRLRMQMNRSTPEVRARLRSLEGTFYAAGLLADLADNTFGAGDAESLVLGS